MSIGANVSWHIALKRAKSPELRYAPQLPPAPDRTRLEMAIRDADAEFDAATALTAVKATAKKLQRAEAELKELEAQERSKRK
jgi:hypothetical protein